MFKSPKPKNKEFTAHWNNLIDSVNKEKIKLSHLKQIEILCDLYIEYRELCDDIEEHGYIFESISSSGVTKKIRPSVPQKNRTLALIAQYSKGLGLEMLTSKDDPGEVDIDDEWS